MHIVLYVNITVTMTFMESISLERLNEIKCIFIYLSLSPSVYTKKKG